MEGRGSGARSDEDVGQNGDVGCSEGSVRAIGAWSDGCMGCGVDVERGVMGSEGDVGYGVMGTWSDGIQDTKGTWCSEVKQGGSEQCPPCVLCLSLHPQCSYTWGIRSPLLPPCSCFSLPFLEEFSWFWPTGGCFGQVVPVLMWGCSGVSPNLPPCPCWDWGEDGLGMLQDRMGTARRGTGTIRTKRMGTSKGVGTEWGQGG